MKYLKCLFFNFVIVFFANHLLPGIEVTSTVKLPHLGGDLLFAIVLGLLNSLIYPALKLVNKHASSMLQIIPVAIVLNFAAYAILKLLPIGIHIMSIEGYLFPAIAVTIVSILTNYYEMKAHHYHHPHSNDGTPTPP